MVTEPLTKPALVAVDMRPARRGERLFKLAASAAGSTIVIAILLIAIFLLVRAVPSLRANHANFSPVPNSTRRTMSSWRLVSGTCSWSRR